MSFVASFINQSHFQKIAPRDFLTSTNNGNLIKDRNKDIDEIVYNHLNLPKKIIFENENTIEYLYDASGTKLRKIVTDNTTSPTTMTTTHYLDGFQYIDDKLEFFPTAEGYVRVTHCGYGNTKTANQLISSFGS